jgi:hypothetical protein
MSSLFRKRHLRYRSKLEWLIGEKIPSPFTAIRDRKRFDEVMNQYGELRQHLYEEHLKTLTTEQQIRIQSGKHPSQDHRLGQAALPHAQALAEKLKHLQFVATVGVGTYHGNRNVLDVFVDGVDLLNPQLLGIPDFFEGFEVLVLKKTDK